MELEIQINGSLDASARYVTYSPAPCQIRQINATTDITVNLSSRAAAADGGELVLFDSPVNASQLSIDLHLPADGSSVDFWIAGKWGSPSTHDQDCLLVAAHDGNESTVPLMVRVRKNATKLSDAERDRFVHAFAAVNNSGTGVFQDFRDMHVESTYLEQHRGVHFLPWHRAYLLDLERELQKVDASVSLHYWRFDEPASYLFSADFIGQTTQVFEGGLGQAVQFSAGHPLSGWVTDGQPGIIRSAYFNTQTESAPGVTGFALIDQLATLNLGDSYAEFMRMEGSPHGAAHVSFGGSVSNPVTAPKDPLFFMLHANVDRLWALWQWVHHRFDASDQQVYVEQDVDGRRLADTLWPWNNITTAPRPSIAPRGDQGLSSSNTVAVPGATPELRSMIDSVGFQAIQDHLGFGYDDVPFERP